MVGPVPVISSPTTSRPPIVSIRTIEGPASAVACWNASCSSASTWANVRVVVQLRSRAATANVAQYRFISGSALQASVWSALLEFFAAGDPHFDRDQRLAAANDQPQVVFGFESAEGYGQRPDRVDEFAVHEDDQVVRLQAYL